MNQFRSKLIFCALGLLIPGTGLNCFYLQGIKSFWAWVQLAALVSGILGLSLLMIGTEAGFAAWLLLIFGFISLEASWLSTIVFGLRPDEKWDAQFNANCASNQTTKTGWPVIITVILSLVIGVGVMMSFLAIGFEQFFIYQLQEAKKLSQ
jgi:hypothetical protein